MSSPAAPRYREIAERFRSRILRGDLRAGDEIPSERALAAEYGISRPTATRALELLRHEGLVTSVRGSGTYVAAVAVNERARDRYQRARESGRIYPDDERARIDAAELIDDPPQDVVRALNLATPRAIRRLRVTLRDGRPQEASTSWFPAEFAAIAPKLLVRQRIRNGTLAYVEATTGRVGAHARDRLSARGASEEEASLLDLPGGSGSPVLAVEHTTFDAADSPIEFVQALYPPDRWAHESTYDLA
ncbi:MAG: GntR family transcriptional regulator [Phycicoccus sp.]